MADMAEHPTVRWFEEKARAEGPPAPLRPLDAARLREICLEAGADDVGFVEIDRPEIASQRSDALTALPGTLDGQKLRP